MPRKCKHCGEVIKSVPEGMYRTPWIHVDGFIVCWKSGKATYAEPEEETPDA